MQIIRYPNREAWSQLVERPHLDISQLSDVVNGVLNEVRKKGDEAVKKYEERFDHAQLSSLQVSEEEMAEAGQQLSEQDRKSVV